MLMTNQEELQYVARGLSYDPLTGVLVRNENWHCRRGVGKIVNGHDAKGYIRLHAFRKSFLSHRLIWLIMTGTAPNKHIDHINGVRDDNRWSNLRLATPLENQRNKRPKGKFKGVCVHKSTGKFQASIKVNGVNKHLGLFASPQEAATAYEVAAKMYFGEFARWS